MSTLVIQSHTDHLPHDWLTRCVDSVRRWSDNNQFNYQWIGDELFDPVIPAIMEKVSTQKVIATDLARLYAIKAGLENYDRVVWLDADFLIFAPNEFLLPSRDKLPLKYMVGREVWVQQDQADTGKLRSYVKVHNAFLFFDRSDSFLGNSFLDFYIQHAEQLLLECNGPMPPQFIGPKLLTAIHNVVGCPVLETAGMLCPEVIIGLLGKNNGDDNNEALNLFLTKSKAPLLGANLCSSLVDQISISDQEINQVIDLLLSTENSLMKHDSIMNQNSGHTL